MGRKTAVGIVVLALAIALFCAGLLLSGHRVLVRETLVQPGTKYEVSGYGDVGKNAQASLVCRYFTGRGVTTNVLWYSSNNIMGKDECPFVPKAIADDRPTETASDGSAVDWFAAWASLAAVVVALAGYGIVEYRRRQDIKDRRQDAAYQIAFKISSLGSEVNWLHSSLFPEGTGAEDWATVTDPFIVVGAQQPIVGSLMTVTKDLTENEQNLLMFLREENFLMEYSEIHARNLTIIAGMKEYKERYAAVMVRLPPPVEAAGNVATLPLTEQLKLELHPYITPAATLIQSLRGLSAINVQKVRALGASFKPMMSKHFPKLHIHAITFENETH